MKKLLIVYDSKNGQTKKISQFMEKEFQRNKIHTVLKSVDRADRIHIPDFGGAIFGAPVYAGKTSPKLKRWIKSNHQSLAHLPTAFFSVCLGILETNHPQVLLAEKEVVRKFLDASLLKPKQWSIFAGGLPYRQYNWFLRQLMKRISRKAGGDTDTSRNYEYTNWENVRTFCDEFSEHWLRSAQDVQLK